ncbi:MAG: hypothetical protein JSW71_17015 [Gemmatimonadota bacterium]|nr:MAG: hypothetical protein JSW71_17015 [Gemmatimonadota bacterium]
MKRLVLVSIAMGAVSATACERGLDPVEPAIDSEMPFETVFASASARITSGFMSGGGILIAETGDPTIRASFAVNGSCDAASRSHISIHWAGGNTFRLNGPMGVVLCADNGATAGPRAAPFDTYQGYGFGVLNGTEEAIVYFIMRDGGRGREQNDMAAFVIQAQGASPNLYLWSQPCTGDPVDCMLPLTAGSLQAHGVSAVRP